MAAHVVRNQLTLLELAKRTNDRTAITIAEVLEETNEWMQDAIWLEANQVASHVTTLRTSLPTGTWRKINQGVAPEASSTKQIVEGIGNLEAYSRVDRLLMQLAPQPAQFRSNEDKAFIEGLGQTLSDVMFKRALAIMDGDTSSSPEKFNGLPVRYDTLASNQTGGDTGKNDDTSIWVVQWGENKVHMIYPRNARTNGVKHEDLGEQTIAGPVAGTFLQAMVSHFILNAGMVIRDTRCVVRVCNIDSVIGTTYSFDTGDADNALIAALNSLPYGGVGAKIYANNRIKTQMDIKAKDKSNVLYSTENIFGVPTTQFRGTPVRRVDAITNTETSVT